MFNTKRIIFLIGLLSLVTLTGALLAGPAFAGKPESSHKTLICHYNSDTVFELDVDGNPTTVVLEAIGWYFRNVDDMSLVDHMAHGDFEIATDDDKVRCQELVGDTVDLDGEADAAEQRAEDDAQDEENRLDALETD